MINGKWFVITIKYMQRGVCNKFYYTPFGFILYKGWRSFSLHVYIAQWRYFYKYTIYIDFILIYIDLIFLLV